MPTLPRAIRRSGLSTLAVLGLLSPLSAEAQNGGMAEGMAHGDAAACPATPSPLPPELASWPRRAPMTAAADAGTTQAARLALGTAIEARLRPTPEMHYALRPEKPGGSVSFGGLYAFTVEQAGSYRVALGSAAWIDIVKAGTEATSARSIAHGHGPDCSGIRKMVDFALEPGTYLLQVSANAQDSLPLLVTRLP